MTTVAYTLSSCICSYHVYKDIWDPPVSEIVICECENRNPRDLYVKTAKNLEYVIRVIMKVKSTET